MALLEVKDLHTSFYVKGEEIPVVRGVSFSLDEGRVLGIVGESGSGKSVTAYSILRLLPDNAKITRGSILLRGEELTTLDEKRMRGIRGNKISIIFQDPMSSLNPTHTIGRQISEAIILHTGMGRREALIEAERLLELVHIPDPARRLSSYPHELSGGMRQRVMIAMALGAKPDILIADEPTTALDVTIQASIIELMQELREKLGMAIIMITHDLGVVAGMCDEVIVMYAGEVAERGLTEKTFYEPRHEYTKALLASLPRGDGEPLKFIGGTPPSLKNLPRGCPFTERCPAAMRVCLGHKPPLREFGGQIAYCWVNEK